MELTILDALYLTMGDLLLGLFLAGACALAIWGVVREERKHDVEVERLHAVIDREGEAAEDWAFPPRWQPPEGETKFHDRKAA